MTEVTIQQLGPQGDGICAGSRGRIFVDRAIPGDRLKVRTRRDRDLTRAEIVEILEPSPYRESPPCRHYEQCGNCSLQHLSPDYYRQWKVNVVKEALTRQALRPRKWLPPVFVGEHRRRRLTFSAYLYRGKLRLGYYRRRSKEIVDIDSCLVVDPDLFSLREILKHQLRDLMKEAEPMDLFLQKVGSVVELVITGPIGKKGEQVASRIVDHSSISRIYWRIDEATAPRLIAGGGDLKGEFGPLSVNLPPAAFLQPTVEGERALVNAVLSSLPQAGFFADLFAGCGTFTGPMLSRGDVDAFESSEAAVKALARSSSKNALNVRRRDLFCHPLRREELKRYNAIVFDPPRAGCENQAVAMASSKVKTLIGVSCNPSTFARDARLLADGGYRLQTLQVVDQFSWSHHVEVVGTFSK